MLNTGGIKFNNNFCPCWCYLQQAAKTNKWRLFNFKLQTDSWSIGVYLLRVGNAVRKLIVQR